MKKYIICLITVLMVLGLCGGCSKDNGTVNTNSTNNNSLIVEDGMIKYSSNGKLEDVITLEELISGSNNISSIDAKEIELFIEDGYIVWNYIGETSSHRLISINDLQGKQGNTGLQGPKGDTGLSGKDGNDGKDGTNAYIWIKYLNINPEDITEDDEVTLQDEASDYMGIYYGTSDTAPEDYHEYTWYNIKGQKGDKGDTGETGATGAAGKDGKDGTNAYVHIKYLANDPSNSNNSDLSDIPNDYMGVYSGTLSTAPEDISSYNWFKIKGETGEQGPKGDTGSVDGSYLDNYYNNLAVVTCSVYGNDYGNNLSSTKACKIKYNGADIISEINEDTQNIVIKTGGDYIIETEGDIYIEPSVKFGDKDLHISLTFMISNDYMKGWQDRIFIDKNDKYGKLYSISAQSIEDGQSIDHSLSVTTYVDSFTCDYVIKIYKK